MEIVANMVDEGIRLINCFSDEYDRIVKYVDGTVDAIRCYLVDIFNAKLAKISYERILECGSFWVGNTYIGVPKHNDVKSAYQRFWLAMVELIEKMGINRNAVLGLFGECFYSGTIYRFINTNKVKYDGVYVSWTKNPELSVYTKEKLGRRVFRIEARTMSIKGIDLTKLGGIGRPFEEEVVFPTLKDTIVEIRRII